MSRCDLGLQHSQIVSAGFPIQYPGVFAMTSGAKSDPIERELPGNGSRAGEAISWKCAQRNNWGVEMLCAGRTNFVPRDDEGGAEKAKQSLFNVAAMKRYLSEYPDYDDYQMRDSAEIRASRNRSGFQMGLMLGNHCASVDQDVPRSGSERARP